MHKRCRMMMVVMIVVGLLQGGLFRAAAQGPGAVQAEAAKIVFALNGDAAIVTMLIKPDKTADFEYVLTRLKDALQKSENPRCREQAVGWRVFKSAQMAQGNAVYVMRIDPVIKGEEYDITRLIAEVFPVEVQELFVKYRDSFAGSGVTELTAVMSMHP
ncbi:MAG: hypothetical protein Q7R30_14760 [Acidobacteriota bacterium]|nr:hypothetical protein [Acidobacteriota bacterium]